MADLNRSAKKMNPEDNLIIYPMPSLVATLLNREKAKGAPLTEEEVIAIRDAAPSVAVTREQATKVDEARGYLDIDPENCWAEWQRARVELSEAEKREPNQPTQRNAGSRPSLDDASASETPSSLGPRG